MKDDSYEVDKNSVIPVYYQIAEIFRRQIQKGILNPGDALPPEHELAARYGVSRMTVRRAIAELAARGLVYTQRGKGTFVARPRLDSVVFELDNFYEEMRQKKIPVSSQILEVRVVRGGKEAEKLGIPPETRCLYLRLLVLAGEEPLVYERKHVVYAKQKPIVEAEIKDPSLSNLVATHAEKLPVRSKRVLQVSVANEEEAGVLGVAVGTPVFLVEQVLYDAEGRPVGWGKSVYRGDRYKITSYNGW